METIKVGILGCANIAIRSLIPAFKQSSDFKLEMIGSRNDKKAQETALQFEIPSFGSYEDVIRNEKINLIYIPLPNGMHFEWIKKALDNNKHVLCEKSLTCSLNEAKQLIEIARSKNLMLFESFQFRFHSQTEWVKNYIQSGELGDIRVIRTFFGFPPFKEDDNIRYQSSLGGGALLDAGAYTVKCLSVFLPEEDFYVKGAVMTSDNIHDVDIFGGALLESKNGIIAQLSYGFDNYYQCGFEIWGSKGKLNSNRAYTAPKDYTPTLIIETNENGREEVKLKADDHFKALLCYIAKLIKNGNFEEEYIQNLRQAKILNDIKAKS